MASPLTPSSVGSVLNDLLPLPKGHLGPLRLKERHASVLEAMSWDAGADPERPVWTPVYFRGAYQVGVDKPGKESIREGEDLNAHDMRPSIRTLGGVEVDPQPRSFGEMWASFEALADQGEHAALVVLGRLLFRNAYFLDHVESQKGRWRYQPPEEVLDFLAKSGHGDGHMSRDLLVYLVELVALNEDVKYWDRLGRSGKPHDMKSVGRVNNLMTALRFVLIHLGLLSFTAMIDSMTRGRGVAAVGQAQARELLMGYSLPQ